jgi:hypothetical protein
LRGYDVDGFLKTSADSVFKDMLRDRAKYVINQGTWLKLDAYQPLWSKFAQYDAVFKANPSAANAIAIIEQLIAVLFQFGSNGEIAKLLLEAMKPAKVAPTVAQPKRVPFYQRALAFAVDLFLVPSENKAAAENVLRIDFMKQFESHLIDKLKQTSLDFQTRANASLKKMKSDRFGFTTEKYAVENNKVTCVYQWEPSAQHFSHFILSLWKEVVELSIPKHTEDFKVPPIKTEDGMNERLSALENMLNVVKVLQALQLLVNKINQSRVVNGMW